MAEAAGFSFLLEIANRMVDPIVRQFSYIFQYKDNMRNLEQELKRLQASREGVQLQVDATSNSGSVPDPRMQFWIKQVNNMEEQVSKVNERRSRSEISCMNVKQRYLLSRKATKLNEGINKLIVDGAPYAKTEHPAPPPATVQKRAPPPATAQKGSSSDMIIGAEVVLVPTREPPKLLTWVTAEPTTQGSQGFASRMPIMKQILTDLRDDTIRMIGISGLGGVGKTTMVNEICQRARADGLFDEIAFTAVSQFQDLFKVQDDLAFMLGLSFAGNTSVNQRAQTLLARLTNGKRILVILDDVWEKIPLEKVGIPVRGEGGRCKVAFTSRNEYVFSDIGTQLNVTVGVLTPQESWDLFEANAGRLDKKDERYSTAIDIVEKCGGLPIAIVTLSKALRNEEKSIWDYVLRQLNDSAGTKVRGMAEYVYTCIELSYKFLKDEEAKNILVLCCLFQEDTNIPLETLLKVEILSHSKAGSANEVQSVVRRLRKFSLGDVKKLVRDLRSSNLLGAGDLEETVKVHDIVREVCLNIEKLNKWPQDMSANWSETVGQTSRMKTIKKVIDGLMDDNIRSIAICGMPGIGKTKMAQDIQDKVTEDAIFDECYTFECGPGSTSWANFQHAFANELGVDARHNTVHTRRVQIREKLKEQRTLLIFDDPQKGLDFQDFGAHDRCKALITTRSDGRTCDKMVTVNFLSREESWDLFKQYAGEIEDIDLHYIGRKIVREAGGLPKAIIALAKKLKDQDKEKWLDTLSGLRGSSAAAEELLGLDNNSYASIKSAYDDLDSYPETKLVLLLCCIMGPEADIPIEKLVMCIKRLKLFGDLWIFDQIQRIVQNHVAGLKKKFLLLNGDGNESVQVQPVVRKMCLS